MTVGPRRFWGWGREGEGPSPEQQQAIAQALGARFGLDGVTITPPFGPRAKAVTPRSISAASWSPIGLTSTPKEGATAWMAPN